MCFDPHDHPPIPEIAGGAYAHRTFELRSTDGTPVRAFEARAAATPSRSAMLILPDARGLHPYYEELALRFAEAGIDALAIDYFARTAGTGERTDDFPYMEHLTQTRWVHLRADISAAAALLDAAARAGPCSRPGSATEGAWSFLTATWRQPRFTGFDRLLRGAGGPAPGRRHSRARGAGRRDARRRAGPVRRRRPEHPARIDRRVRARAGRGRRAP